MTGSDHVQIPIEHLHVIGSSLEGIKNTLLDGEQGIPRLAGYDDVHGERIKKAVDSFYDEWQESRKTLIENIGKLGVVSLEIAVHTTSFDSDSASALTDFSTQLETYPGGTM